MDGKSTWEAKAASKRAAELAKIRVEWRLPSGYTGGDATSSASVMGIPAKCGLLTSAELDITGNHDAVSLAKAVQSGSLKAASVATAFCKRAAIAQQLTNCLTETFFDDAIQRGQWLDQYLVEHKKPVGPLHGVPISIKDPFNYVGVASTLGFVSYLDNPLPKENSPLVDVMLDLGAILYCKTNIPQTMMTADSHNNVFGRVLNPHRLMLGAGGSSGGEGALVAIRGSILGVGTDIGGSIRIPAICCGTYGFKPTPHRIPYGGQAFCTRRGSPCFPAVAGPLATSFQDLEFFTQAIIDAKPWDRDATAVAIPWRSDVADSKPPQLRIGYFKEDPDLPVFPPVFRALEASAKALEAAGFEVVPLTGTPSLQTAIELTKDYWSMDNSRQFLNVVEKSGEPFIPSLQRTMETVVKKPEGYTLEELFDINVARGEYKTAWNKLWVNNKLDVILCPGAQTTAVPHDNYGVPHYTAVWNLVEVSIKLM